MTASYTGKRDSSRTSFCSNVCKSIPKDWETQGGGGCNKEAKLTSVKQMKESLGAKCLVGITEGQICSSPSPPFPRVSSFFGISLPALMDQGKNQPAIGTLELCMYIARLDAGESVVSKSTRGVRLAPTCSMGSRQSLYIVQIGGGGGF